jgi:SsrA-binding protein
MGRKAVPDTTICRNRKAKHRFEILEKIECGVVLGGSEVKSLRDGAASIEEAYARIESGELWLIGVHIGAYRFAHTTGHEPLRRRKLLVHGRELRKLKVKVEQKGTTLVPLSLYFSDRGIAKLLLGIARGKSLGDKRQTLKTRDHLREMERAMRGKR